MQSISANSDADVAVSIFAYLLNSESNSGVSVRDEKSLCSSLAFKTVLTMSSQVTDNGLESQNQHVSWLI